MPDMGAYHAQTVNYPDLLFGIDRTGRYQTTGC